MTHQVTLTFSSDQHVATIQLGTAEERAVALNPSRMASFVEALRSVKASKAVGLIIKAPSLDSFCVGADISMIESVIDPSVGAGLAAEGQRAFDELEDLGITTVAAISGACVGGGCELVLACTYRVISHSASSAIGLPETKLGIIPGFGGTYRLPRLVGLPKALDIILAGKTLRSSQALKVGLVDEVTSPENLLIRATEIASGVRVPKRRKRPALEAILTTTALGRAFVAQKARKATLATTKGKYPAPLEALQATVAGLGTSRTTALAAEALALGRMIVSPESKALVQIYFLTEASKNIGKQQRDEVKDLHALVVGAGVMGAGIAASFARAGHQVIVRDTTEEALARGKSQVEKGVGKSRSLSSLERGAITSRIDWITHSSPTEARTGIVIEAVFENMDLKKNILSGLAKKVPSNCILATNTSSLSVTEIATSVPEPHRVVGMHFFNPVEKMPLVEIIRGKETSDETVAKVAALASKLGKFPIVVHDVPGFLVNRILVPYLNEALFLLAEGHSIKAIDEAAEEFGMPMGPIRLLDEVGLDVAAHVSDVMTNGYGARMTPPPFSKALLDKGRKGRKSGGGFYDHAKSGSVPWAGVSSLLALPSAPQNSLTTEQIQERLVYHLVNEAMKCLNEGVAGNDQKLAAQQIDLGTVMGIGFPPFRGGVLHYANRVGLEEIRNKLKSLEATYGSRYASF